MYCHSQELLQGDTKTIEDVHALDSDNEDDAEEWMPDPIDADPCECIARDNRAVRYP